MRLKIGNVIDSRYQIIQELGEGGFAAVFLAEDTLRFDSKCVVKQFVQPYDAQSENGAKAKELFQKEAQILHDLEAYPQIPNLLAYYESEAYIIQEHINGDSLEEEKFDEDRILDLLGQLLPVLRDIHTRGIFHRDITPANIMINRENGMFALIDFGISKQISSLEAQHIDHRLPKSTAIGTSGYKAPEDYSSAASDLYSLGATCYYLLTGCDPLFANDATWINVQIEVKSATEAILRKLFEEDISIRYKSAEEVLKDLQNIEDVQRNKRLNFLLSLLDSDDEQYQNRAIEDLREFGADASAALPKLIDLLREDNYSIDSSIWWSLAKIGKDAVPFLSEQLISSERSLDIRRQVAQIFKQIHEQAEAAIPNLIRALDDDDPQGDVRWYAVVTLGKIGAPAREAIPALIQRLEDSKAGVRAWALYALGRMGDLAKEAETAIRRTLSKEKMDGPVSNEVFIAGIEALDAIGASIDEIEVTYQENTVMSAREWVFFCRRRAFEFQEEAKARNRAIRKKEPIFFLRPVNTHTPPQENFSQI